MPQYLLSVIHDWNGPELPPEEQQALFEAVDAFNKKITEAGHWVFGGGLMPPDTATVVDGTKGSDVVVTDGPYLEAKEHLGGFWVIRADDLDVAMQLAEEASRACQNPIEVRPFQDEPEG